MLAAEYAQAGYPLTATALTQRAIELGAPPPLPLPPPVSAPPPIAHPPPPPHPTSPPPPPPVAQPAPVPPSQPAIPFPIPPGVTLPAELAQELSQLNPAELAQVPEPQRSQVLIALATEKNKTALEALAQQMEAQGFPVGAKWLRAKIGMLRLIPPPPPDLPTPPLPWTPQGTPAVWPIPAQPAPETPVHPAPLPVPPPPAPPVHPGPPTASPAPAPVPPAPPAGLPSITLDQGIPATTQNAVLGALLTEQEPGKLEAFAHELQAHYPVAAGLLMAKANAMRLHLPGLPPLPPVPTTSSPTPPAPAPTPSHAAYPVGDESTRSGRNAGRPTGYPFIHLRGESTYPAKIAKEATGSEANFAELSNLNPHFAHDGTHWINIQTGDAINIPWAWAPKLATHYHLELDPGVTAPAGGAAALPVSTTIAQGPVYAPPPAASTALAVAKGGNNGLVAHS